jgi:hypothetical protein
LEVELHDLLVFDDAGEHNWLPVPQDLPKDIEFCRRKNSLDEGIAGA